MARQGKEGSRWELLKVRVAGPAGNLWNTSHDCPTQREGKSRLFFTKPPHRPVEGYCDVYMGGVVSNTPLQPRESPLMERLQVLRCSEELYVHRRSSEPQVASGWTWGKRVGHRQHLLQFSALFSSEPVYTYMKKGNWFCSLLDVTLACLSLAWLPDV